MLDGIVLGVVNILEASGGRWKRVEGLYESERGKESEGQINEVHNLIRVLPQPHFSSSLGFVEASVIATIATSP